MGCIGQSLMFHLHTRDAETSRLDPTMPSTRFPRVTPTAKNLIK